MKIRYRISGDSWERIQNQAKADAQDAFDTGKTKGLTALGRAYYQKLTKGALSGLHNRSATKKT
tara:strand:- start:11 stop:202 length:192 start_codon:yes stop_codon:yes gene_type:complete